MYANPQTIRELIERIIRTTACPFSSDETDAPECSESAGRNAACDWCAVRWDAVAALELLDNADERFRPPSWKMSDAPQERFRLVPDPPAPRGDADA